MKICLAIEPSGGGSGRHVIDLARGLSRRGHCVSIMWSPDRADTDWRDELLALKSVSNFPVEMKRSVGLHDLKGLRLLTNTILQHGPFDIIHGHSSKAGALIRLLPRSVPGKRIYTPHALITMDPTISNKKKWFYGRIERKLSKATNAIITVSEAERRHAQYLKLRARLETIVNGVDKISFLSRIDVRKKLGLSESDFAVGFIGRLATQKNPERFVRILSHSISMNPNIKGIVIGDGELMSVLQKSDSAQNGAIKLIGWQAAAPLLMGLDLFLMTSRYEAMPYTYVEALSAGLPIISTRVGGVEEAIDQGRNGWVFEQDCEDSEIASQLVTLSADSKLRDQFSQASLRRAKNYTVDIMVDQTVDLYEKTLVQP